jgi:hypothetical protein
MTADPTTWTDLKTSLANWLNRSDLSTTEIPEAIALAERRFNRTLRVPEMEDTASASASSGSITLPTDFMELRAAYISADPKVTLEPMSLADLRTTYAAATTGKPQNYALQSGNEMVLGPSPDATYTIVINYWAKIPALGGSQATNWLLTAHPDLYIYASRIHLFDLMKDWASKEQAIKEVGTIMYEINQEAQRKARGAGPIRIRSSVIV